MRRLFGFIAFLGALCGLGLLYAGETAAGVTVSLVSVGIAATLHGQVEAGS
jgi:hypothetical protein